MINDLNNTLKQLLIKRVPLDPSEVDISFDCPKREWSSKVLKPTVNLYLFDLRENVELRTGQWITQNRETGRTGRKFPLVHIDLSYFVTCWAREVEDEHLLLWRAMVAMMREMVVGEDLLQGTLRELGAPCKTTTAQADGVLRNPGEFWNALDNDLKPAVIYSATLAVDLNVLIEVPLALTKRTDIGDMNRERVRSMLTIGGAVRYKGRAKDGGPRETIANAQISFPNLGIDVRSDEEGRFAVQAIPAGRHRVRVATPAGLAADTELEVPGGSYDLEVKG